MLTSSHGTPLHVYSFFTIKIPSFFSKCGTVLEQNNWGKNDNFFPSQK